MGSDKDEFARYCCELLGSIGPCVARRMFGGWGISTDDLTVAIVADLGASARLWLKASEASRTQFEAAGCVRFTYDAKGKPMSMNYYSAPDEAMEAPQFMAPWAQLALQAAVMARAAKAPKRTLKPARPRRGR